MRTKLFLTRELPELAMQKLANFFDMRYNQENRVLSKAEILEGVNWCDILLCLLTDNIDKQIVKANPKLKGISNYAVGYNNIDVKTATELKIPVCNTPGVLTETTADLTWSLIFSVARRIVEADKFTRDNQFKGWAPLLFLGGDVYGKTLGIIGAGRIGTAVAKRAAGFNMKVLYTDNGINETIERAVSAKKVDLESLLRESDFVSVHTPLLPETKNLIGESELKIMKKTAYLINTARGQILDEKALVKALQDKWIAGAGLDVYYNEPELTAGLTELSNVILLPHIASASIETRTKMGLMAYENAVAIAENCKPPAIVNPEIYL